MVLLRGRRQAFLWQVHGPFCSKGNANDSQMDFTQAGLCCTKRGPNSPATKGGIPPAAGTRSSLPGGTTAREPAGGLAHSTLLSSSSS